MRIAYVTETYPPELNGVALTVERCVRHLRERGHELLLVRPRQRGEAPFDAAAEWRTGGCPIPMYPELRFGLAWPAALARRFARQRIELVHAATEGPLGWAAAIAARRLRLPLTSDFRTRFDRYSAHYGFGLAAPLVGGWLRAFHRRAGLSFVPTEELRDELAAAGCERLAVLGRGVDAALFAPGRRSAALRAQWGAPGDAPVLLHVGRLAPEKNVELALRTWQALRRRLPEARCVVVGDGPLRRRLEAQYPDAVFAGVQRGAALAGHYASADLFLFPSLSETFGNVVLEALAAGLPVVAYATGAAAAHMARSRGGRLAPPGDETAWARAVQAVATQPERWPVLRREAREIAEAADWDGVLLAVERHLQEQCDAHRARDPRLALAA